MFGVGEPSARSPRRSDSAIFPGFFSILCSVFRDSVVMGPIRDLESVLSMKTETLGAGEGGAGR